LRDDEMLPYREIERSVLHRSFRRHGIVLGQIMTVQVPIQGAAHGGLTLYRTRRRAFTDRDRALLQLLAPMLAGALRSHHFLGEAARRGAALDALLGHQGGAAIGFCPPATELWRTAGVTPLLSRWFSPADLLGGGLPRPLLYELRRATAAPAGAPPPRPWVREGEEADLVPQSGPPLWLMVLKEVPHAIPIPADWSAPLMPPKRRLAPREREVAGCVLKGWDNETIAGDLMCSLATVKKHLVRVFIKLGVESRAQLMNKAYREQP
jgi:DNA-binding CsgD family transcriptional regulator